AKSIQIPCIMKILYYCQHVLGMGHFFRSLEICRGLHDHQVVMVSGGDPVNMPMPAHVQSVALPPVMMDPDFKQVYAPNPQMGLETIQSIRRERLLEIYQQENPDILMVELYPFGRKAFRFELDPLLAHIQSGRTHRCRVICSLRDILVEKTDVQAYENRVVHALNQWFDAVLIHADPRIVQLDETFFRLSDIIPPLIYTGFVTPRPKPGDRNRIRSYLGLTEAERLVVVSAGGGKVGKSFLTAVRKSFSEDNPGMDKTRMQIFTGPFLDESDFTDLICDISPRVTISRFTPDFPAWLAAADLSISMAGYNTCMNILAAGVKALVWPFDQNREQGLRARKLERLGYFAILPDLNPDRLSGFIEKELNSSKKPCLPPVMLDGAAVTADWIGQLKR
ncbi:MAG: glycosyltransferase family protein, partial [Desulfatirhabdiaceae bacterium]